MGKTTKDNLKLKKDFLTCQHSYQDIKIQLQGCYRGSQGSPRRCSIFLQDLLGRDNNREGYNIVVLLQFLFVSASTKSIDPICHYVTYTAFCVKTLSAYPPAVSATTTFQAAQAALSLSKSYAEKSAGFAAKAAKENPNLKKQFAGCQDAFVTIIENLKNASRDLKESPDASNYEANICTDSTAIVKDLVRKNGDMASRTILNMTLMMEKFIDIAVGATMALGG
ncbi:unnamed protein product [Microthlaspi erraticum]|uniref:Pectinesterase inhibitor domain-containing protein n=1 Tax=Microthlaspi erraticum TaxID=1685480 RepID=A0A6D2I914_9BRAS|nr:unnamed protein product [Microthlaspi erraticum]